MEGDVWLSRTYLFDICPEILVFELVGVFVTQNNQEESLLRKRMKYIRVCFIILLQKACPFLYCRFMNSSQEDADNFFPKG